MRDPDSGDCVLCPEGTYRDRDMINDDSCTSCPEGTITSGGVSDSVSSCFGIKVFFFNSHIFWEPGINISFV